LSTTSTTTSTTTTGRTAVDSPARMRLTASRVMHSEWLRLVTTRSTLVTLLAAGAVMALIGLLAAAVATGSVSDPSGGPTPGFDASDPLGTLMAGSTMVVLVVGVLGVMIGAREYGSGLVRTTYAAVPRRWPVLVARVAVFAATSLLVIGTGTLIAFVGGNALLEANGSTTASWGDDGVVRALVGNVVYLVGTGVIGIALGTLTRSIGLGIGAVVALIIVIPGLGGALLPDSWQGALDYLPSQAAVALTTVDASADHLGVADGSAVLAAWVVGLVCVAAAGLVRRDV
jgi:ABC-2 type transport system permease protein